MIGGFVSERVLPPPRRPIEWIDGLIEPLRLIAMPLRRTLVAGALGAALAVGIHLSWAPPASGASGTGVVTASTPIVRDVVFSSDALGRAADSPADNERVKDAASRRPVDGAPWALVVVGVAAIGALFFTRLRSEHRRAGHSVRLGGSRPRSAEVGDLSGLTRAARSRAARTRPGGLR